MTQFIRTFHPIGQGAFYSEKHIVSDNKTITIVYDCGSETFTDSILKKKVNASLFEKRSTNKIDILFISHFHEDHINGIKYLNPRIIIIPMLSDDDIIILNSFNVTSDVKYDIDFALNPHRTFPESTIIRVKPANDDTPSDNDDTLSDNDVTTIEKLLKNRSKELTIKSGKCIKLNEEQHWVYIPFNYNYKEKKEIFKKAIEEQGLNYDKLNVVSYILKETTKIREATKKMKGGPNEQSLIVYSGPTRSNTYMKIHTPNSNFCPCFYNKNYYIEYKRSNYYIGCVYLGDSFITEDLLKQLYKTVGEYTKYLGTIQIPHHGSRDSYSESIIKELENRKKDYPCLMVNFVISCGTVNRHGHPSDYVVEHLLSHGYLLNIVTEQPSSILTQKWSTN